MAAKKTTDESESDDLTRGGRSLPSGSSITTTEDEDEGLGAAARATVTNPTRLQCAHVLTFDVVGEPMAEPRPRAFYNKHTGRAGIYHDKRVDPWKRLVRSACQTAVEIAGLRELVPSDRAMAASMVFRMPRPKDHYRGKARVLRPTAPVFHLGTPDGDNLAKAVLDCVGEWSPDAPKKGKLRVWLPNLVWCNDSQVAHTSALKIYADAEPGVHVTFSLLEGFSMLECFLTDRDLTPGEALVLDRRRADLTQVEAADLFGVDFEVYRSWESQGVDCPRPALGRVELHEQCFVLRRRRGLRLADVSRKIGLSMTWLGQCERGDVPLSDQLVAFWREELL